MKTYRYGAKAPTQNAELVAAQLKAAHRYRNALVDIERWKRVLSDGLLAPLRAARGAIPKGQPKPKLVIPPAVKADLDAINKQAVDLLKQAYHESDAYWATKLCVADAVERSVKALRKLPGELALPRFRRFDGSGTVAVQIQSTRPLQSWANDSRVRLVGQGKRRELSLRVGSDGLAPIWAKWPVFVHREPDGEVRWAKMTARKVGTKLQWSLHLSLDGASGSVLPSPVNGTVAIDVGWRRFRGSNAGLRVAAWVDDAGRRGELRVPERLLERWRKTEDLISIRDKNHNTALAQLLAARKAQGAGWPDWLREATQYAHAWNKPARLAALVLRYHAAPAPDAALTQLFADLEEWRKQDKHLYEWEGNQRQNVLLARRELYRVFAKWAASYRQVAVEQLDLRDFAELPDEDEPKETPREVNARPNRFKACVSELLRCLLDATQRSGSEWVECEAAMTTQTCGYCAAAAHFDAAENLSHTCPSCGREWDQDYNAARNLLRAARSGARASGRSRADKATKTG